jgi:hypothetical protein
MDALLGTLAAQVSLIIQDMSQEELLAQRMAALLQMSHKDRYGYEKIIPLLTQENGTQMHEYVRNAFVSLSGEKLGIS